MPEAMDTECDGCGERYDFLRRNATAYLFLNDPRCNHVRAECPHCGAAETIFLPPDYIVAAVDGGNLRCSLYADASQQLRVTAERTFLAIEEACEEAEAEYDAAVEAAAEDVDLSDADERVVSEFAKTLRAIPTAMLWDGFGATPKE